LVYREKSLEEAQIDYADKGTVEAVLKTLEEKDERSVLFGLELAEKLDPKVVVARLPRGLLRHSSPAVRARAIELFALRPDSASLNEINEMLKDDSGAVQAAAVNAACAIFKRDAIPVIRPYLGSSDPQIKRRVVECLLRHGDAVTRETAVDNFRRMVEDATDQGTQGRIEAARLAGEVYEPVFPIYLGRLIRDEPSAQVIHAAMAAAGQKKYPGVVRDIVFRLC